MTQSISETPPANRGDAFQETVATWLSRPVPERAQNQCFDFPAILATDIGLQREENQDRVAALRLSARQSSQPIIAVVVADGMGGMRDGARCATLAASSFFYALVRHRHQGLEQRAAAAVAHANDAVYAFAGGRGGATLSALLFDAGVPPVIINLGDSRIYACGKGVKVERLTVDDSLEEAVGGHGRELLQFVGMGAGMQPHIRAVPSGVMELALTTDGIQFGGLVVTGRKEPRRGNPSLGPIRHDGHQLAPRDQRSAATAGCCNARGGSAQSKPRTTERLSQGPQGVPSGGKKDGARPQASEGRRSIRNPD
jgi:PPM family protein phosphatase